MSSWDLVQLGSVDDDARELHCCFKGLAGLGKLTRLTSLTQLNVSFNSITSLEGIQSLQHLQQLNISHNSLSSIEQLSSLQRLAQLICSHNKISSTQGLLGLPKLQFLALHSNRISRAVDVLALQQLPTLQHLTLRNNAVCKQDNWQQATVAALPSLQALDSLVITAEQRAAATAFSDLWALPSSAVDDCATGSAATASSQGRASIGPSSRRSTGSAGRLRPRMSCGAAVDDSTSIKDATSLLPNMSLQPLKPSSLVRRAGEAQQPSPYGYSRAKPVKVLQKQTYEGSAWTASTISSDGSASLTWPEGAMAASLDPEEPSPAGSIASSGGAPLGSSSRVGAAAVPPILGYRMLAMYRSIVGVAVSCDSSGGFVQWPNGQLMLVWNKKEGGTAYDPDGRVTHTFSSKRKGPGSLTEDITAHLNEHLSIVFLSGSRDLQLQFDCEGCGVVLSQRHGAVLPDRASQLQQQHGAPPPAAAQPGVLQGQSQEGHARVADTQQQPGQQGGSSVPATTAAAAAAAAGLPGGDEMQALLARARALMAATDLSQQQDTSTDGGAADEGPPAGSTQSSSSPADADGAAAAPSSGGAAREAGGGDGSGVSSNSHTGVADDNAEDLQAMMARARAALVGLQGLTAPV